MRVNFLLFFVLWSCFAVSQQRDTWYFGNKAGLKFSSTGVTAISSSMDAIEACAVQNDVNGEALFYTDGSRVWDKFHNLMPNGSNLSGGQSATQTVIIPRPGSCRQFYIFSASDHLVGSGQLTYSMVDLTLGTAGDVAVGSKNIVLHNLSSEKIAAVRHANGADFWVVTHELESTVFNAYLVSASGVSSTPVASSAGSYHGNLCMIGSMKISPDGTKLALANSFCAVFEMLDFNKSTGQISNQVSLTSLIGNYVYGLEFSPSGRFLYASQFDLNILYQIDLTTLTAVQVGGTGLTFYDFSGLERGPDGKIYMARDGQSFISAVNFPDVAGTGCGFVTNAITLAPGTNSEMGLPSFIADDYPLSMMAASVDLGSDTTLCGGSLLLSSGTNFTSYQWNTGSTSPQILVSAPGVYSLQASNACGTDIDSITVDFAETDTTSIIVNKEPCTGKYTFSTETAFGSYLWDLGDGTTSTLANPSHTYSESGTYTVVLNAMNSGCPGYATLSTYFRRGSSGAQLSIPNVFTPNDDNINDQFMIAGIDSCNFKSLTIYNRWGEVVFQTRLFGEMWDGHLNSGEDVPGGIYFYTLELVSEERKGYVQLHR